MNRRTRLCRARGQQTGGTAACRPAPWGGPRSLCELCERCPGRCAWSRSPAHPDSEVLGTSSRKEPTTMSTTSPTTGWIKAGLVALPLYGLLVGYATLTPQPDQTTAPQE